MSRPTELIILDMANYQPRQVLTSWTGDAASLLTEMKRQAGVGTDQQLAAFMGVAQSTVAYWRTRAKVPESAVLKFERIIANDIEPVMGRAIAARMIVFRLAEYWYQDSKRKGATGGRGVVFRTVALSFQAIVDAVYEQLESYEAASDREPYELAARLLEDDAFILRLLDWIRTRPLVENMARELLAPPYVHSSQSPQSEIDDRTSDR